MFGLLDQVAAAWSADGPDLISKPLGRLLSPMLMLLSRQYVRSQSNGF